jgi:O-antigen/teichoic acid export membrane protein
MGKSYLKNYLSIYVWQGIAMILNFFSMMIVIPFLTSNANLYGIYTICTSFNVFLTYADLGFLSAGQKYAAEYFVQNDNQNEIKVVGFTIFILALFLSLFSLFFWGVSLNPQILINNVLNSNAKSIASNLFLLLSVSTPIVLMQRLAQIIYGVRVKDYLIQRLNIIGSIFKVIGVYYFFYRGSYSIVSYFAFTQFVNFCVAFVVLYNAKKLFLYDYNSLFKAFRFDSLILAKTKKIAFASFYLTVMWVLYYELDSIFIGKFLGPYAVAIYSIGIILLTLFRSLFGILFSPFNVRFNHFIGELDFNGLYLFFFNIIRLFAPIIVIPLISIVFFVRPLILTWVGFEYIDSIFVSSFLILCNLFAFLSYPTGMLIMAKEQHKNIYFINTFIPIFYWIGILLTYREFGVISFSFFKFIAFTLSFFYYTYIVVNDLKIKVGELISKLFIPLVLPLLSSLLFSFYMISFLPTTKGKLELLFVVSSILISIFTGFLILFLTSKYYRSVIINLIIKFQTNGK